MHIVGPWNTSKSRKCKEKVTKAKQEELERNWRNRNQRLKEMHLPKETFEQYLEWVYGHGKKEKKKDNTNRTAMPNKPNVPIRNCQEIPQQTKRLGTRAVVDHGGCTKKPAPVYTGSEMVGIATMHKSNMVPIFSSKEAEDISKMRR